MKKFLISIAVILIAIQFFQPEKNISKESSYNSIEKQYAIPSNVNLLLRTSCYDCHSNNTKYPWYSNIQPVGWWLSNHINEGKRELNFDEFNSYTLEKKKKKISEIIKEIDKKDMPLSSYTLIHRNAELTAEQQQEIIQWAKNIDNNL
ncbi:heme-binding domain-containing protein [Flavobacterium phragmitis]|uniref:Haem-binding domain-containing protein n=1 Tax=Flavobacterium phragmitis TaxID=739143 RepID=A0A1I1X7R0_9FLAO|nr:heme-binding domain-containing protein [Flavobacterium phragmitis]SFE03231.1 Haem-binding domain-containing protein [Flavobacterium phragmitis]